MSSNLERAAVLIGVLEFLIGVMYTYAVVTGYAGLYSLGVMATFLMGAGFLLGWRFGVFDTVGFYWIAAAHAVLAAMFGLGFVTGVYPLYQIGPPLVAVLAALLLSYLPRFEQRGSEVTHGW